MWCGQTNKQGITARRPPVASPRRSMTCDRLLLRFSGSSIEACKASRAPDATRAIISLIPGPSSSACTACFHLKNGETQDLVQCKPPGLRSGSHAAANPRACRFRAPRLLEPAPPKPASIPGPRVGFSFNLQSLLLSLASLQPRPGSIPKPRGIQSRAQPCARLETLERMTGFLSRLHIQGSSTCHV